MNSPENKPSSNILKEEKRKKLKEQLELATDVLLGLDYSKVVDYLKDRNIHIYSYIVESSLPPSEKIILEKIQPFLKDSIRKYLDKNKLSLVFWNYNLTIPASCQIVTSKKENYISLTLNSQDLFYYKFDLSF